MIAIFPSAVTRRPIVRPSHIDFRRRFRLALIHSAMEIAAVSSGEAAAWTRAAAPNSAGDIVVRDLRKARTASVQIAAFVGISCVAGWTAGVCYAATGTRSVPAQLTTKRPKAVSALAISISDGRASARPGDILTYRIHVINSGPVKIAHLTITETIPDGLRLVSASDGGSAKAGTVVWHAMVPPGTNKAFTTVARVTRTPDQILRLASVACAAMGNGSSERALICSADLDRLPAHAGPAGTATPHSVKSGGGPFGAVATWLASLGGAGAILVAVKARAARNQSQRSAARH
jgi:uncharacterized repeat protein (TIGR01451 family)